VIAEIVSNSTKPAVGFKDSAADDIYKDMKGDINVGTKEDMNLDNDDDVESMDAF